MLDINKQFYLLVWDLFWLGRLGQQTVSFAYLLLHVWLLSVVTRVGWQRSWQWLGLSAAVRGMSRWLHGNEMHSSSYVPRSESWRPEATRVSTNSVLSF